MAISKTGCSRTITKTDLDAAHKQGFSDCAIQKLADYEDMYDKNLEG